MGRTQKIPYIKEVVIYSVKFFILYFVLRAVFIYFNIFSPQILAILALFLSFPMKINYLLIFMADYFIFFLIEKGIEKEFILLFIYLSNTLINTFIIMLYVKYHVLNKEK